MKETTQVLIATLIAMGGMYSADVNAGPFKYRFSSGYGHAMAIENSPASSAKLQSNAEHDEHGGHGGSQYDPLDSVSTLENESNDDGNAPIELLAFESPGGGVINALDIPAGTEVTAQAVREPSTVALLLASAGLLFARRPKRKESV
ncbi:MAG: PEP-CTERM sorting domain-containing protein [Burkholderiales bacterium]